MGFNKEVFAANLRAARAALDMPGADKIIAICRVVRKSPNELMGWKETA